MTRPEDAKNHRVDEALHRAGIDRIGSILMRHPSLFILFFTAFNLYPTSQVWSQTSSDEVVFGIKLSVGGRYDDVRMCVATDPGVR